MNGVKTKDKKAMKTLKMRWTGIRPLVMHNGLLADPMNEYAKKMKEITSKKKKSDADHLALSKLEWEGGLTWSDELGPCIPADNIERCIQLGAQKKRVGKDVQAAVFCSEPEFKLGYDGPRTKEKLWESGKYLLRKIVAVQRNRVVRSRPIFPTGWTIDPILEYDDDILNEAELHQACIDAGMWIGLGDWKPKFGRFIVEITK